MASYENQFDETTPGPRQLTKGQRRMIGVLLEKAFTTPDQYPLTLKGATTGANQKSNRDPVTNYTEGGVWDAMDELRELGLVTVVHPESGRTERFRHLMRKRYPFTEPQLAIMAELMLRGRQQLGELRARASRMVAIESLDELRQELTSLQEQGYIQASGALERRGIEVDHNMYTDDEGNKLEQSPVTAHEPPSAAPQAQPVASSPAVSASNDSVERLKSEVLSLRGELSTLQQTVEELKDDFDQLRQALGA